MNVLLIALCMSLLLCIWIAYYVYTKQKCTITVSQKFSVKFGKTTVWKIFDGNRTEYHFCENLFMSNTKCVKLWDDIIEGNSYTVEYYGLNLSALGLNRVVISATKIGD